MPWTPPNRESARRSRSFRDLSPEERLAVEAEAAEFEARFNAQTAADPKSRAAWEAFQRDLVTLGKRLMNAIRGAGVEGEEPSWQVLMKAWRSVGLPIEDFGRSHPGDLIEVLEAKANVMERIKSRGSPTSRLLRKKALKIGRPEGKTGTINIRGDLLRARREDKSLTQASFAHWLRIPRNTYRRAEVDGLATEKTARAIADRLGLDLQELVRQ